MKIKTHWDLKKLFYTSLDDPRLMEDVTAYEKFTQSFARKYKNDTSYLSSPKALKNALDSRMRVEEQNLEKPLYYLFYRSDLNTLDTRVRQKNLQLQERYTKAATQVYFFYIRLSTIPQEQQRKFLRSKLLAPYHHFLRNLFKHGRTTLSEPEEKVIARVSDTGRWTDMVEALLAQTAVGKGQLPFAEALESLGTYPKQKRRRMWSDIRKELKKVSAVAEHELNALVAHHKIMDELRGRTTPEEATITAYDNDPKVVTLLAEVTKKQYSLSHRFYALHKKLLGYDTLTYVDRIAPYQKVHTLLTFEKSVPIIAEAFGTVHPEYKEIFLSLIANGQVDAFPNKTKQSGAFCSTGVNSPTMVFLNHVDDLSSFTTLAHEMGHAIHGERSKQQPVQYQGHSTATAETASTFFEQVALDALKEHLPPKDRVALLHASLQRDIATVFRQIAGFYFEQNLHQAIRTQGFIPKEEIAKLLVQHLKEQLGPAVGVEQDDGYSFVYWSHFRRFFYVYTYAYGQLISKALFRKWKQDASFGERIDAFLSAGESSSPEAIFRDAGCSFKHGEVFVQGLKQIEEELNALEKHLK